MDDLRKKYMRTQLKPFEKFRYRIQVYLTPILGRWYSILANLFSSPDRLVKVKISTEEVKAEKMGVMY